MLPGVRRRRVIMDESRAEEGSHLRQSSLAFYYFLVNSGIGRTFMYTFKMTVFAHVPEFLLSVIHSFAKY